MLEREFYVYILTNKTNKVFYVGVTNDIVRRIIEHKAKINKGFTAKYNVDRLVYYEVHEMAFDGIMREKQLKNWHRAWKINIINQTNPNWKDLSLEMINERVSD